MPDSKKATKILKIDTYRFENRKSILDLPQELRDMIHEHTLVELPLWYRRHKPGCPMIGPSKGSERPVFKTTMEQYDRESDRRWRFVADKDHLLCPANIERCRATCQGRKGLALLRACKQIYAEANPLFWKNNMFCLETTEEAPVVLESIPDIARLSVRRLSMSDFDQTERYASNGRPLFSALWTGLNTLKNLQELELSPRLMSMGAPELFYFKHLAAARVLHFERLGLFTGTEMSEIYFRFTEEAPLRSCYAGIYQHTRMDSQKTHMSCMGNLYDWGYDMRRSYERSYSPLDGVTALTRFVIAINRRMNGRTPAYTGNSPQCMTVQLLNGTKRVVGIFGLPNLDRDTRVQLRKRAIRAVVQAGRSSRATNARKVRSQDRTVVDLEEVDFNPLSKKDQRQSQLSSAQKAQAPELRRRTEEDIAEEERMKWKIKMRHEQARQKSEAREAQKSLRRAMEDLNLEKKALRRELEGTESGYPKVCCIHVLE